MKIPKVIVLIHSAMFLFIFAIGFYLITQPYTMGKLGGIFCISIAVLILVLPIFIAYNDYESDYATNQKKAGYNKNERKT